MADKACLRLGWPPALRWRLRRKLILLLSRPRPRGEQCSAHSSLHRDACARRGGLPAASAPKDPSAPPPYQGGAIQQTLGTQTSGPLRGARWLVLSDHADLFAPLLRRFGNPPLTAARFLRFGSAVEFERYDANHDGLLDAHELQTAFFDLQVQQ